MVLDRRERQHARHNHQQRFQKRWNEHQSRLSLNQEPKQILKITKLEKLRFFEFGPFWFSKRPKSNKKKKHSDKGVTRAWLDPGLGEELGSNLVQRRKATLWRVTSLTSKRGFHVENTRRGRHRVERFPYLILKRQSIVLIFLHT